MADISISAEPVLKVRITFNEHDRQYPFWGEFEASAPQLMLWQHSTRGYPMCDITIVDDPTPNWWPAWLPNWPLRRRKMEIHGTSVSYDTLKSIGLFHESGEEAIREAIRKHEGKVVEANSVGGYYTVNKKRRPTSVRGYARVAQQR